MAISITNLSCLSVCVSLTKSMCDKMLTWDIYAKVKDQYFVCPSVCPSVCLSVCPKTWNFSQNCPFLTIYDGQMEQCKCTIFLKHLSHNKNNFCNKFENHWTKYRATNPVWLNIVLKCHKRDIASPQPNEKTQRHEILCEVRLILYKFDLKKSASSDQFLVYFCLSI